MLELRFDCLARQLSPEQFFSEEDDIIKKKYAYAYLWYESIHKKYSTANLNKYFFTSLDSTNEEYYEFQEIDKFRSGGHWILSSSKYLHLIDQLYRKKLNGG